MEVTQNDRVDNGPAPPIDDLMAVLHADLEDGPEPALSEFQQRIADYLANHPEQNFGAIARALGVGRTSVARVSRKLNGTPAPSSPGHTRRGKPVVRVQDKSLSVRVRELLIEDASMTLKDVIASLDTEGFTDINERSVQVVRYDILATLRRLKEAGWKAPGDQSGALGKATLMPRTRRELGSNFCEFEVEDCNVTIYLDIEEHCWPIQPDDPAVRKAVDLVHREVVKRRAIPGRMVIVPDVDE